MHYLKFPGEHSLQVLDSENLLIIMSVKFDKDSVEEKIEVKSSRGKEEK